MEVSALLEDTAALLPHVTVLVTGLVVLVLDLFALPRGRWAIEAASLTGLALAFWCALCQAGGEPRAVFMGMAVVDGLGTFFNAAFVLIAALTVLLSAPYVRREDIRSGEYYALILFATLGFMFVGSASDLVMMFLAIETFSMATYILAGLLRDTPRSLESAFKYFMLGSFSSAFFLYGIATLYGALGTTNLLALSQAMSEQGTSPLLLTGMGLLIVGLGFKVAVVPFHMWAPDVYQGAPTPVTAYLTTVSKGAMVALLLRYGQYGGLLDYDSVASVLAVIAVLSMFLGNLLALLQDNLKRLLAYSSIAHLGYLLVAVIAASREGSHAVTFYLVAYFITSLGIFGIITALSDERKEADEISDYRGLFWRRPWVSGAFSLMLFSLAGIPLTAGFVGKFYVLTAGVLSDLWALVILLVVSSVIGLYYYLRIIITMYLSAPEDPSSPLSATRRFSLPEGLVLVGLTVLLIWFGIYPAPLLSAIQAAVGTLA